MALRTIFCAAVRSDTLQLWKVPRSNPWQNLRAFGMAMKPTTPRPSVTTKAAFFIQPRELVVEFFASSSDSIWTERFRHGRTISESAKHTNSTDCEMQLEQGLGLTLRSHENSIGRFESQDPEARAISLNLLRMDHEDIGPDPDGLE